MKYVCSQFITFLCALGLTAALTGCDDPAVEVGTLGKKLSAPTLKSASPFDQDFNSQKYVHVSGTCDTRVGDLSVSFKLAASNAAGTTGANAAQIANAALWHTPPSNPDTTGTSLTGTITNDVNCADGVFDFYLTKNDLYALWGFDGSSDNNDVDAIYLKGATLIGDTQVLSLIDPKTGGGSSGNTIANKIVIEKQWPQGFAGSGHCESFNVFLTDGNGNSATSATPVTFNLSQAFNGGAATSAFAYTSWDLCNKSNSTGAVAGVSSFTISAGQNSIQLMMPMPTDTNSFDKTFVFNVTSTGLTSGSGSSVILRDSSSTAHRWVAMDPNGGSRFHKDTCYPININRYTYSGSSDNSSTSLSTSLSSTNSKLKFYSDASCTTGTTSFLIAATASTVRGYIRYNSEATETNDLRIPVTLTSTDPTYDLSPFTVDIDIQGQAFASRVDLWGPNETDRSACTAFMAVALNDRYTLFPVGTDLQVDLTSTTKGNFFTASDCSGTATTSVTIPTGKTSSPFIFFRGTASTTAGIFNVTVSSTGYTSTTRNLTILPLAANNLDVSISATSFLKNTCLPVVLYPMDNIGVVPASGNVNFNYTISGSYASLTRFYSDSVCTIALSPGTATTLTPTGSNYQLYIKTTASESLTIYSYSWTFSNGNAGTQGRNIQWVQ